MHVRIAWEIYNHQQKNADPSKSQPSSLTPTPSLRDSGSRILNHELTKKMTTEADRSKMVPSVISRNPNPDRQNPFGLENRISVPKTSSLGDFT
jgi:Autism susceptibility gene 2 protein